MSNRLIWHKMSETTFKGNPLLRGERLQVMLEIGELRVLDDFRFRNRLPSRAAAVRELLRRGLQAEGFASNREDGATSREFGVLEGPDSEGEPGAGHLDGVEPG
jgi:hypothetical protein